MWWTTAGSSTIYTFICIYSRIDFYEDSMLILAFKWPNLCRKPYIHLLDVAGSVDMSNLHSGSDRTPVTKRTSTEHMNYKGIVSILISRLVEFEIQMACSNTLYVSKYLPVQYTC